MTPVPYYDRGGITIYCGDCRTIVPQLGRFDLLLTDPPYGIGRDKGNASRRDGRGFYRHAVRRAYPDSWDVRPDAETMRMLISRANLAIVWGGNYLNNPPSKPQAAKEGASRAKLAFAFPSCV